jgi:hypothetical protein
MQSGMNGGRWGIAAAGLEMGGCGRGHARVTGLDPDALGSVDAATGWQRQPGPSPPASAKSREVSGTNLPGGTRTALEMSGSVP